MLHRVMRPSIVSERTVLPAYSIVQPVPPAEPILPIIASATSFAVTPRASGPSMRTSMFFIFFASRHCVESTCSTSEVPMPNARQPNAPWVLVCESPHTTVIPGSVAPCSGPMTCTMPWRASFILNSTMPYSAQFLSSVSTCRRDTGSTIPAERSVVGTL